MTKTASKKRRRKVAPPRSSEPEESSAPEQEEHTIDGQPVGLAHLLGTELRDLVQTEDRPRSLHQRNIVIIGQNGEGKSSLVESDPNCFIFDADQSGAQNPKRKAVRFPDHNSSEPVTFSLYNRFVDSVVDAKRDNPDLPIRFAVDRVDTLMKLAIEHAEKVSGRNWDQLDGRQWYTKVYQWIMDSMWRLNKVGVGVTWIGSALPTRATVNGKDTVETGHSMSTGLQGRLQGEVEEIFYLYRYAEVVSERDAHGKKTGGRTRVYSRCMTADKEDVESSTLQAVLKNRLAGHLTQITIRDGDFNSWTTTIKPAYEAAIESWMSASGA